MADLTNSRWLLPVAIAVTVILVAVAGVLAYDQFARPGSADETAGLPDIGVTARAALKIAARAAAGWHEDAGCAGAVVHYRSLSSAQEDAEWAFQFYSPSTRRLGLFVVEGREARLMRESLSPTDLSQSFYGSSTHIAIAIVY